MILWYDISMMYGNRCVSFTPKTLLAYLKSKVGLNCSKLSTSQLSRRIIHLQPTKRLGEENCIIKVMIRTNRQLSSDIESPDGSRHLGESSSRNNRTQLQNGDRSRAKSQNANYLRAIQDLNLLQSNTQGLALAKYKKPETIIPLFKRQLILAGINIDDLDKLNIIHVSGTKGKGSTCAFTESILRAAGLKTGFYNSPHLVKVTERIKINGLPIEDELFSKYFREVFDRLVEETRRENIAMPSYFSFLTILAFHIFIENKVDCALVEVGIGGEYDPTNVVQRPVACCITTLDLDHTNILGKTIESIAWTKAGIIKAGAPIFTIEHEQDGALRMIQTRADEKKSPLYICKPLKTVPANFDLGIKGSAQYTNAALACQLAMYLIKTVFQDRFKFVDVGIMKGERILTTHLTELPCFFQEGLKSCTWPGRCQIIEYPRILFFLDGAHTKKSVINCLEWFNMVSNGVSKDAHRVLMVNIIGERDKSEILRPLAKYEGFNHVIFSTNRINPAGDTSKSETFVNIQGPNNEKSLENLKNNASIWESLMKENGRDISNVMIRPNTLDSLKIIDGISKQNPDKKLHVLVTGSLHFVGAIIETLQLVDETIIDVYR